MSKKQSPKYKPYRLRAWWYNRKQTAQECAISIAHFLNQLETLGAPFINWTHLNSRRKSEPIPRDVDEFRKRVLIPIWGRRGAKPDELDSLGFGYLVFGDGKTSESVSVEGDCGGYAGHSRLMIQFPRKGTFAPQLLQLASLSRLLEISVQCWDPDWATVEYFDSSDPDCHSSRISVYWFTYLAQRRGQFPPLPEQCPVKSIEGFGNYVIVTPEPFDRERPDHLAISGEVKAILDGAGLLKAKPDE